ncbi:MAG TPA: DUF6141 family protein [Candidatus Acidoferrum sp.]|nr:DUF6141 family protein [Candidatus Acidoferrum sp.]
MEPLFKEVQRFRQWWILALIAVMIAFALWMLIQQIVLGKPVGNHPVPTGVLWMLIIVIGALVPLFMLSVSLTTTVTNDRVVLRFFPIYRRVVRRVNIESFEACEYHPILEYGGWGIRWGIGRGIAYTVRGKRGVRLILTNGRQLLIGSQKPEELAAALNQPVNHSKLL